MAKIEIECEYCKGKGINLGISRRRFPGIDLLGPEELLYGDNFLYGFQCKHMATICSKCLGTGKVIKFYKPFKKRHILKKVEFVEMFDENGNIHRIPYEEFKEAITEEDLLELIDNSEYLLKDKEVNFIPGIKND